MSGVMDGKYVLITGVRNKWSIAWHSAKSLHREGAKLIFSVFSDREAGSLQKLLKESEIDGAILQCDATDDMQVEEMYKKASAICEGKLDGLLHAMAFANKEELAGEYASTSKAGFNLAHEASVYSLVTLARGARPLMKTAGGGSIVTLSYIGAARAIPNYNVMGVAKASLEASVRYLASDFGGDNIRVNAISAAPIKTLAASGITGFDSMLKEAEEKCLLHRRIEGEEVGDSVLMLLSPWARAITGEVIYVDGGYHVLGL